MKKNHFDYAAMFLSLFVLSAFMIAHKAEGRISGSLCAADSSVKVYAIRGVDTIQAKLMDGGKISLTDLVPAKYTLFVDAPPPYQIKKVEKVVVIDGLTTDVGTIILELQ